MRPREQYRLSSIPPPKFAPMPLLQLTTRAPPELMQRREQYRRSPGPPSMPLFLLQKRAPWPAPHRRSGKNNTAGRRRCCRYRRRYCALRQTLRRHSRKDTGTGHSCSRKCCCSKCHCRRRRLLRSLPCRYCRMLRSLLPLSLRQGEHRHLYLVRLKPLFKCRVRDNGGWW